MNRDIAKYLDSRLVYFDLHILMSVRFTVHDLHRFVKYFDEQLEDVVSVQEIDQYF
jgi:hypothetical protein